MPSNLPKDEYQKLLKEAIPTMKALSHLNIEPLLWNENNKNDYYCIAGVYAIKCGDFAKLYWAFNISGAIDDKLNYLQNKSEKIESELQNYYDKGHKPFFWITKFSSRHDTKILNNLKKQEQERLIANGFLT